MAQHDAIVRWSRNQDPFLQHDYSRVHSWHFDGGSEVRASASPAIVPPPHADPAAVDPEEAFVASLAACHMLFFLDLAARAGWVVDEYEDRASATLAKNDAGQRAITEVSLCPRTRFKGAAPDREALAELHSKAHSYCFLANSVNSRISITPVSG